MTPEDFKFVQDRRKKRVSQFREDIGWNRAPRHLQESDISALAGALEGLTPDEIAEWIVRAYGGVQQ